MTKPIDIGWRASYPGQQAHFWRKRPDLETVVSLCWIVTQNKHLTDRTSGHHCSLCEIMKARINGSRAIREIEDRRMMNATTKKLEEQIETIDRELERLSDENDISN